MVDVIPSVNDGRPEWVYVFGLYLPGQWRPGVGREWYVPIFYKIGVSSDPRARFAAINTSCPGLLRVCGIVRGNVEREQTMHKLFDSYRISGEWFCMCQNEMAAVLSLLNDTASRDEFRDMPWYDDRTIWNANALL